jgi:hypothetical protein
MKKQAYGMFPSSHPGPTLGSLEWEIMRDQRMDDWKKRQTIQQLHAEVGPGTSKSTPLADLLPSLGGGLLGWLVAKYFNMSPVGQALSAAAGFGVGKLVGDFYQATNQLLSGDTSFRLKRL